MMGKESGWINKLMVSSILLLLLCGTAAAIVDEERIPAVVRRDERKQLMVTEYGQISSVDVITASKGPYHIEFITLNPNSLFLPVLLHADMVFYVHTGSGKLSWGDGEDVKRVDLRRGDVYRVESGSVFFLQSDLDAERHKLRVHAIFTTTDEDIWEPSIGAYSSISDLVLGFDNKLLQSAFGVSEDMIEEITSGPKPKGIVHAAASAESEDKKKKRIFYELENRFLKVLAGGEGMSSFNGKNKKSKTFNILESKPDFENCNGWSLTVDKGNYKTLKGSHVGVFMVNLTKGAMMGPHWNPMATEIAVVIEGEGMVRVVCSSNSTGCKNKRFMVSAGDVFVVPRFHPMAQMSFNNESFVFMGFSTTSKKNHPQFLAGKRSVLQTLDRDILGVSFNASNTTIDRLLDAQDEAIILECVSCAEEELRILKEEIEKERKEEEERRRKEEEERKKREEEEEERRKREEEEERKKEEEEEERKRKEEEEREEKEEEARREQEKARREEEERQRKREEEEERKRREEEERERKEEEARREQEKAREEEEEKQRKREEEEERKRKEEEEASREQEAARKEEEERKRKREEAEEEAKREREEEEEKTRQEEEEEERQRREEERRRQEEEEEEERQSEEEEEEQEWAFRNPWT
ncbi:Vicilin-like seed storage protein At2g18540 [Linum perenne]